ncbi:unnamed protein product, partial [Didymodactylos carnosus]
MAFRLDLNSEILAADDENTTQINQMREKNNSSNIIQSVFEIIWLDEDSTHRRYLHVIDYLKQRINHLNPFHNSIDCITYLKNLDYRIKVLFVIAGDSAEYFIPLIHHLVQIKFFYIYSDHQCDQPGWIYNYSKICDVLINEYDLSTCLREVIQMSVKTMDDKNLRFVPNITVSNEPLWFSSFIDVLLKLDEEHADIISHDKWEECRLYIRDNDTELKALSNIQRTYTSSDALTWYTTTQFLAHLVNNALETENIDMIFKFRFFIKDIYEQLLKNYANFITSLPSHSIKVYRLMIMTVKELNKLRTNTTGYIMINTFLSATRVKNAALDNDTRQNSLYHKFVLLEIDISKSCHNTRPFANVSVLQHYPISHEILFMAATTFRIHSINEDSTNDLLIIQLTPILDDENTA